MMNRAEKRLCEVGAFEEAYEVITSCIFRQNRTSVPEGRDAVPLQTVR